MDWNSLRLNSSYRIKFACKREISSNVSLLNCPSQVMFYICMYNMHFKACEYRSVCRQEAVHVVTCHRELRALKQHRSPASALCCVAVTCSK